MYKPNLIIVIFFSFLLTFIAAITLLVISAQENTIDTKQLSAEYELFKSGDSFLYPYNGLKKPVKNSWNYFFPGNAVTYTIASNKNINFEVEFFDIDANNIIDNYDGPWVTNVEKITREYEESHSLCRYKYVGQPDSNSWTSSCPNRSAATYLKFSISNDVELIGKNLSFRIRGDNFEKFIQFIVSNPKNATERLLQIQNHPATTGVEKLYIVVIFVAFFGMLFTVDNTLKHLKLRREK